MADTDNEEAELIPKKPSFTSATSKNRSRTGSVIENAAFDFQPSVSPAIPTAVDGIHEKDDDIPLIPIRGIYKNLLILSFAMLAFVTAYVGILSLQSSLNTKGNVGVNSLIVTNVFLLFSSIFLTGIIMDIFGLKWTLIISVSAFILYMGVNIRPTPIPMYIGGALVGIASTPLWSSQGNYIVVIARYHAHQTKKKVEDVVSLFFGIFFAIFGTCGIWGNLTSYFLLNQSNHTRNSNCGVYFDPLSKSDSEGSENVSELTLYVLCGIFVGMGLFSLILILFFLDQIRLSQQQPIRQSLKKSLDVLLSFFRWKHIDQLFLMPITMWNMVQNTFLTAQFTRAFITCLVGIRFIGLVLICNGICNAMSSYIFGSVAKHISRPGCILIGAALNYTAIIFMYCWNPLEDQMYILFIISGIWGVADAIWQTQVVAAYTVLYSETDPNAITKYHLWKGVGALLTYSYTSYITMKLTLIILFSFLTTSMICYGIIEIHIQRKAHAKKNQM